MLRLRSVFAPLFAASLLTLLGCAEPTSPAEDAASGGGTAAASEGNAFTAMSFNEAMEANRTSGDLLIVDATATWCGPCKRMEREAWSNPEIIAWVEEHGTAIQFDFDQQKNLAQELGIQALPTIIAFRNGEEIGRRQGYRSFSEFKTWLESLI